MRLRVTYRLLPLLLAFALLGGCDSGVPEVLALNPNARQVGKTYGEWAAAWWQWAFSIRATGHPLLDTTGANAANGQSGNVWFLGGTFGSPPTVTRSIHIPAGVSLFFPLYNFEEDTVFAPAMTVAAMRAELADLSSQVTALTLRIDGTAMPNLTVLRGTSPGAFAVHLPASDDLYAYFGKADAPRVVPTVVADGYWAFINPLNPGAHTLEFGGTQTTATGPQTIRATYNITVDP